MHAGTQRLHPVDPTRLTSAQQAVVATFGTGSRKIQEPVGLLLHNPSLAQVIYPVLTRLRNRSLLSDKLRELAILVAAHEWRQGFEWEAHAPLAAAAGLGEEIVAAIACGERPASMGADEATIYDFCRRLHETKSVDDETFQRAVALLGTDGVLELCWLSGSYASLAMVMNVAGSPPAWAAGAGD